MTVLRLLAQFAVLSFLVLPWFSDPSIVNNLASRTLGQIRVRFTKFRHWPTRWKTQLAQRIFCVRNFKWKFGSFPCSYYFLFSYLSLKYIPPHDLFYFSGFSSLRGALSSIWALFRCSFVFISDRSLSNKTFQIVCEQHSWVLCAQHSGSSRFNSVQII